MLFESFLIPLSKQFVFFFSFSVMITWRAVSVKPVCFVLWRFTVQLVRRPWCHTWPSCLEQRFEFILVSSLLSLMDQDKIKVIFHVRDTKLKSDSSTGFEPMTSQVPVSGKSWVRSLSGIQMFCLPNARDKWAFRPYHLFTKLKIYHLPLFCGYRFDSRLFKG